MPLKVHQITILGINIKALTNLPVQATQELVEKCPICLRWSLGLHFQLQRMEHRGHSDCSVVKDAWIVKAFFKRVQRADDLLYQGPSGRVECSLLLEEALQIEVTGSCVGP